MKDPKLKIKMRARKSLRKKGIINLDQNEPKIHKRIYLISAVPSGRNIGMDAKSYRFWSKDNITSTPYWIHTVVQTRVVAVNPNWNLDHIMCDYPYYNGKEPEGGRPFIAIRISDWDYKRQYLES